MGRFGANVLLASAAMLAALLIAEGLARSPLVRPQLVRADRIVLPANTSTVVRQSDPGLDPTVVVSRNDLGLRGPGSAERHPGSLSVITVGGSTTESVQSNHESSWPGLLATLLQAQLGDVWLNMPV